MTHVLVDQQPMNTDIALEEIRREVLAALRKSLGVAGMVLAIVTSPIWLIILWFAYKKHLEHVRDLAEQPSAREPMVSGPGSLVPSSSRI